MQDDGATYTRAPRGTNIKTVLCPRKGTRGTHSRELYPRGYNYNGISQITSTSVLRFWGHNIFLGHNYTHYLPMTSSRHVPAVVVKLSKRVLEGIEEHHKTCLRECFDCHYQPLANGHKNRSWVTGLAPQAKAQIRLHLCVVLRGDILDWTDDEVGRKILRMYTS